MPNLATNGGLTFSSEHLRLAREQRQSDVIQSALPLLDAPRPAPLDEAYMMALRYLWAGDEACALKAWALLREADLKPASAGDRRGCQLLLGWLAALAMLRRHEGFRKWRAQFADQSQMALADWRASDDLLDALWRGALQMAIGLVFERASLGREGAATYRRAIAEHIHPEGYLKGAVDGDGAGETYEAQVLGTAALALMAEMAEQLDLDLWSYDSRAVTVHTAAAYTFYYYFFPEKWPWESGLTRARTMAVMRREGAFFELVHRRQPMRGIEAFFAEQRPLFCAHGGGLTTLTHGLAPPKKQRWRLW